MKMNNLTPAEMVRAVDNDANATENERALAEALDKTLKERDKAKNEAAFYLQRPYDNG
jgi:hypothetical protein